MILAGDIGGTKSRLAFFSPEGDTRTALDESSLSSQDYPGLAAVLKHFLQAHPRPVEFTCFGVPGPVREGRSETPNLPWVVDTRELRRVTGSEVVLINDLEATAYGIPTMWPEEFLVLSEGRPSPDGNAALIAPGTGLGEAILFWDGNRHRPSASEGGHCTFAARNALEMDFKLRLQKRYDHVSYDRVVSGSGLRRLYNFLKETGYADEPNWLAKEIADDDDPAVVISRVAIEEKCELCVKALDMWTSILGAEAGNLALKALATAGMYVGGGIAPKILPKLKDGTFLISFHDKGRLSTVVGQIPVRVILNDKAALYGTANYALEHNQRAAG